MRKALTGCSFACIAGIFLYFAGYGLTSYFTSDDVMNIAHLHGYFTTPKHTVLLDALNPFSLAYRPLGGVFYRVCYAMAGLNPLPFRCACFAFLLLNLYLAYRFVRLLTGSAETALTGVLLFSYNSAFTQLYSNSGTIYDILCFTCCVLGLTEYLGRRRWWLLTLLTMLALQAKEIGCMLAAGIVLYQLWFRVPAPWSALGPIAVTVGMLAHRILTPNPMGDNPLYRPTFSLHAYLQSAAHYQGVAGQVLIVCWVMAAVLAWMLRSRVMAFGLSFWIVGLIPICLIPPRDGYVLYVPALGLVTYFGMLAAGIWKPRTQPVSFGLCALAMALVSARGHAAIVAGVRAQDEALRRLITEMPRLHPTLKPNARILFLNDPFGSEDWAATYSLRLLYRDPGIWVDRAKNRPHARQYDFVFDYSGDLVERAARNATCGSISDERDIDDSNPRICWQGAWVSGTFPQAHLGTITYSSEPGAKAVLTFTGSRLIYVYTRAPNRGMALVTVDGVRREAIDLYAPSIVWQSRSVLEGLGRGTHTAELSVLNRKRDQASAVTVDVDGFVIQ